MKLAQFLALNLEVAAKIENGEPVMPPGVPPEPPEKAAPTTPESNPVQPSQTESNQIKPDEVSNVR